MSTDYQLSRMGFRPGRAFNGFESLSDNGKEIYCELIARYDLDNSEDVLQWTHENGFIDLADVRIPVSLF